MSSTKSPSVTQAKPVAYEDFQGLDSTRDVTALDTGRKQHLYVLNNGFCDWRGQIVRDPGATSYAGRHLVRHVNFYSKDGIVWAEQDSALVHLKSDSGASEPAYTRNSNITSTVFNRTVHFFSAAQQAWTYSGNAFALNPSPALDDLRPGFGMAVSRRLAVAGIPGRETEVHLSRADDHTVFPADEDPTSTNVLRAGKLDIANYTGAAESITALARFEQNKLAIFTSDRAVLFTIDPDIGQWAIDERATINVGCISQNTVALAGEDVIFCSRSGVHALSRSSENGITIISTNLADKVDILYRQLISSVTSLSDVSAVFDQDMGQYHIFFPQFGGTLCKRLTLTLKPGLMDPKWSTADFLQARCGAFQGGKLFFGTPGGVYAVGKIESADEEAFPELTIETPVLWHGDYINTKSTQALIIQASGDGNATLEVFNDESAKIHGDVFQVSDSPDDNNFMGVPLSRQYERRFELRYRGARLRLTVPGKGLLRIMGFAVVVRRD